MVRFLLSFVSRGPITSFLSKKTDKAVSVSISGLPGLLSNHQTIEIERLQKENDLLRKQLEGWKRLSVISAVALEPMRMSRCTERFSDDLRMAVDTAVIAIRMAMDGHLPPKGSYDDAVAHVRAIMQTTPPS